MASQILSALITVVIGVGGCLAYFWGRTCCSTALFPANASNDAAAVRNIHWQAPSGRGCSSARR